MADKAKVKWWDTFNPFAHKAAADKAKPKAKKKTVKIDWSKRVKEQEAAKAKQKPKQTTPKKSTVKVVKPKKKRPSY